MAKVSFFVYVFFLFFPTSAPFHEITSVDDIATTSPFNQFVFSTVYLASFTALLQKREALMRLVRTEKVLCLFLLWSFLTVAWSDYPFVSLKRWLQSLGSSVVIASALLHFESPEASLRYFKAVLVLYIPLTFLALAFVPGAIQWEFPAWRGLAEHKNTLGQISLVSLITWSYALKERGLRAKAISLAFWGLSLVLLAGAQSTTSLVTGGVLLFLSGISFLERTVVRRVVGPFLATAMSWSFVSVLVSFAFIERDLLTSVLDLFEKDMTLTGRTELWTGVFEQAQEHPVLGCGFGGFWIVNSRRMDRILDEVPGMPIQAHSGYLDVLNETGIVGALLVGLMLLSYVKRLLELEGPAFGKWFFVASVMVNLTESTLFRTNMLTGALFTFAYLSLQVHAAGIASAVRVHRSSHAVALTPST